MRDEPQALEPLPGDVGALLDAERGRRGPPADVRARIFGRLALALGLLGPGGPGGADGTPSMPPAGTAPAGAAPGVPGASSAPQLAGASSAAASLSVASLKAVVLAAFVIGAAAGAGVTHLLHEGADPANAAEARAGSTAGQGAKAPETAAHAVPLPTRATTTAPTIGAPSAAPMRTMLQARSHRRTGRRAGVSAGVAAGAGPGATDLAPRDGALAAERALVERARAALARARPSDALASLAEHRARFAEGQLVEEREALTALTLAARGQYEAAQGVARALRRRFPQSLLLPAVEAALATGKPRQLPDGERPEHLP